MNKVMVQSLDMRQVKKLGLFFRTLSGFIAFFAGISTLGLLIFGFMTEGVNLIGVLILIALLVSLYVSLPIAFTGYPPKLLLWTSPRDENL